jgi:hypothetical protein
MQTSKGRTAQSSPSTLASTTNTATLEPDVRKVTIAFRTSLKHPKLTYEEFAYGDGIQKSTKDTIYIYVQPEMPQRGYTSFYWLLDRDCGFMLAKDGARLIADYATKELKTPYVVKPQRQQAAVIVPTKGAAEMRKYLEDEMQRRVLPPRDGIEHFDLFPFWEIADGEKIQFELEPVFVS